MSSLLRANIFSFIYWQVSSPNGRFRFRNIGSIGGEIQKNDLILSAAEETILSIPQGETQILFHHFILTCIKGFRLACVPRK